MGELPGVDNEGGSLKDLRDKVKNNSSIPQSVKDDLDRAKQPLGKTPDEFTQTGDGKYKYRNEGLVDWVKRKLGEK
jgi:hypothetical protein